MNIAAAHTYTDSEDSFDFDFLEDYTEFVGVEDLAGEMDPPNMITSLLITMNLQLNRGRDSFGGEGGISRGAQLYLIMELQEKEEQTFVKPKSLWYLSLNTLPSSETPTPTSDQCRLLHAS